MEGLNKGSVDAAGESKALVETKPNLRPLTMPGVKGFLPGHAKAGGRKKGTPNKKTKYAQQIAEELKVDPVRFMLMLLNSETIEVPVYNPSTGEVKLGADGKPIMQKMAVPLDMRLDAAKAVAPYVHPRLAATQVTGNNDGPLEVAAGASLLDLMGDPEAVEVAQRLALKMAELEAVQKAK